jgi:hypothetical protein
MAVRLPHQTSAHTSTSVLSPRILLLLAVATAGLAPRVVAQSEPLQTAPGYRGIWFTLGQVSEYGDKYSGGLGTYTAKHHPLAVYAPEVNRTFFVYGGTTAADERHLLAMIGLYDHTLHRVPRPTIVHVKDGVNDPRDNPSINIDFEGHLWVFVSGRGRRRPGFIYRSTLPHDITRFEQVLEDEFTYPQPWWIEKEGLMLLFTRYTGGRELYWMTSTDGHSWSDAQKLVRGGHYQVSNQAGRRVITAFNSHPDETNVDGRTNLYFLQTDDMGATWRTAEGLPVSPPLESFENPALVRDYQSESRLVYVKDIQFDLAGRPIVLYLTSADHRPGPAGDPRVWTTAYWVNGAWRYSEITTSTHNYDMGSLYVEEDGSWRVFAPTEPGPQPLGTGGEVAIWISRDEGASWVRERQVTSGSLRNHGYVRRPVRAHPDFYAFWADGDPDTLSISRLYFTNRAGDRVWRLPYEITGTNGEPEAVLP